MKKTTVLLRVLLLAIIICLPKFLLSQSNDEKFITLASEPSFRVAELQNARLNHIKQNRLHKSVKAIQIGNFTNIIRNNKGSLPIQIPGDRKTYLAKPVETEYYSEQNYKWVGKINSYDGEVIVICKDGEVFGSVTINERSYEIQSLERGKNILVEFDNKALAKTTCGLDDNRAGKNDSAVEPTPLKAATSAQANVRVLVLYTSAASNAVSSIGNTATLAVSQLNQTFGNSLVNSNVRATLAGVASFSFSETSNDIDHDVNLLAANSAVQTLRDTYQADLVVLLTDGNYVMYGSSVYGIVHNIGPVNASAYAIVEADMATGGRYTFTHEVGHLFGGRHENDYSSGSVGYDHGYKFLPFLSGYKYTMMHRIGNVSRIPYFSNPDVTFKNKKTGSTTDCNVARRIRETCPTVEAFRLYTPPLSVYISGPSKGDNSGTYTWTANVNSGVPPYTYNWDYSYNGISYNDFGSTPSVTANLPLDYNLYLRVTVTSSDNQEAVDFHLTVNMSDIANQSIQEPQANAANLELASNSQKAAKVELQTDERVTNPIDWTIFPNPATERTTVAFMVNQKGLVTVEVVDLQGRVLEEVVNREYEAGFYQADLPVNGLAKGIYLCRIKQGAKLDTKKIIVY